MRSRPRRGRRAWSQRLLILCNLTVAFGLFAAAAGFAYSYRKLENVPRIEISGSLGQRTPTEVDDAATNYLLVGVDSAANLDPDDPVRSTRGNVGGLRSDTMMVLRVDPGASSARLLSLPRDLYVPLAGTSRSGRLNEAIQIGGPSALIETIGDYLGIGIDHYVQVDFYGFGAVVDALGGVPAYLPYPVRDKSGLHIAESGCVVLDSATALSFVRARHYQEKVDGRWRSDPTGDIGRTKRQQVFITLALRRAFERGLRNPVTLDDLIDTTLDAVVVDDSLTGDDIIGLATQFRSFSPEALETHSLPVVNDTVGGASVLRLQTSTAQSTLELFRAGSGDGESAQPADVRVRVLNGTGNPGEAADVAGELRGTGFSIAGTGDARSLGEPTTIRYPESLRDDAELLSRWLRGAVLLEPDGSVSEVTLVTGPNFSGLRDEPRAPSTSSDRPTGSTTTSTTDPTTVTTTSTTTTAPPREVPGTIPSSPPDGVSCG